MGWNGETKEEGDRKDGLEQTDPKLGKKVKSHVSDADLMWWIMGYKK